MPKPKGPKRVVEKTSTGRTRAAMTEDMKTRTAARRVGPSPAELDLRDRNTSRTRKPSGPVRRTKAEAMRAPAPDVAPVEPPQALAGMVLVTARSGEQPERAPAS